MTNDYSTEAMEIANAADAVFENKQVNKKDDVSGDYSSDTESYPTVRVMKSEDAKKVNISDVKDNLTSTDTDKPLSAKQGKELKTLVDGKASSTHEHPASEVKDANSANYTAIGSLASNATQQTINGAINSTISDLKGIKFIEITNDKGTASADTMNKLYIVSENSKVNIYYTKATQSGGTTTYSWEKMDADILDELVVNWSDIQGKPTFISQTDIDNSISDFASQLAEAINPTTP